MRELELLRQGHADTQRRDVLRELLLERPPIPAIPASNTHPVAAVRSCVESLAAAETLQASLAEEDRQMRLRFADCFPTELPPVTELPTDVYHRFNLKDASVTIQRRQYESPKKYRETWK